MPNREHGLLGRYADWVCYPKHLLRFPFGNESMVREYVWGLQSLRFANALLVRV